MEPLIGLNALTDGMYFSLNQCSDLAGHPGTGDDRRTNRRDELHLLIGDL